MKSVCAAACLALLTAGLTGRAVLAGDQGPALPPLDAHTPDRPAHDGPTLPAPTPSGPESRGGRQDTSVALEWIAPPVARLREPMSLTLAVQNTSDVPVFQVVVRARLPQTLTVSGTEPKAALRDDVYLWDLGTLAPQQRRNLQIKVVADQEGHANPEGWVTFTSGVSANIRVRMPRLAVKVASPSDVVTGDEVTFVVTVSNPGSLAAEQVKVRAILSEGLERQGRKDADCDIVRLEPGESRTLSLACAVRARGVQRCEVVVESEGGLRAADHTIVKTRAPSLDLRVGGPSLRYVDRKALYTFTVTNKGDAPATSVTLNDAVPAGFKVLGADNGGRYHAPSRQVAWLLGDIPAGESREVTLEVLPLQAGEQRQRASVEAGSGPRSEREFLTRVEGLSTLLLDVTDSDDPIEVNGEMTYKVRVSNAGTVPAKDVKVACTIPDNMELKDALSTAHHRVDGKSVLFDAVPQLEPGSDVVYHIRVKALSPGLVRFKAQLTSAELVEPVVKMEATRVYSDTATGRP
jgi:uncharacterized repeat protein (TIGR01451 family)